MAGVPWTSEEIEILKTLADKGFTTNEISRVLQSRTPNSIENQARVFHLKLGLTSRKPKIDHEALKELLKLD